MDSLNSHAGRAASLDGFAAATTLPLILVVGDASSALGLPLESRGFRVVVERPGEDLPSRVASIRPDMVLLDASMPDMGGIDVCRRLKAQGNTRDIPVMLMIEPEHANRMAEGFEAGAVDCVFKPLRIDEAVARIRARLPSEAVKPKERRGADRSRERERFYHEIFQHVSDSMLVLEVTEDGRFRYLETNRAFETNMRVAADGMRGCYVGDMWRAAGAVAAADAILATLNRCLAAGAALDEEIMLDVPAGRRIFHYMLIPLLDDAGRIDRILCISRDITERKRMEAELLRQAEFQQGLLDAIRDVGMQLMMIENGRIIHVGNRELAREFGYTDEEMDAHPLLAKIIHPDDRAMAMDYHRRRLAGEAVPASYELGLVTRNGERREYDTSVTIVPGSDPVRIITIGRDITERKQAEAQLQQSLEFTKGVIDAIPDILLEMSGDGRYLNVWTRKPELLAAQREALLGRTVHEVLPADAVAVIMAAMAEAEATGVSFGHVIRLDLADGAHWFELSFSK
ncbi:MAG TPA: PAS domain-containing protein, partial [Gallionella sp.]|nr:PAS domain-containing protein [Gallionella sp.]